MHLLKTVIIATAIFTTKPQTHIHIGHTVPESLRRVDEIGVDPKDFSSKVYDDIIFTFEEGYNGSDCNHGIMASTLRRAIKKNIVGSKHISQISPEESKRIMYTMFFKEYHIDTLLRNNQPKSTAYIYDFLVNANPSGGIKYIQRALGVPVTCKLDYATRKKMSLYSDEELLVVINGARVSFYLAIIEKNPKLGVYRKAWLKRTEIAKELCDKSWSLNSVEG